MSRFEKRLTYFALDVPHKAQASYVHIREIVANLRLLGWHIETVMPEASEDVRQRGAFHRLAVAVFCSLSAILKSHPVLYVRSHPLAWMVTFAARLRGKIIVQEINGTELDVVVSHPWLDRFRPFVRWLYFSQYRSSSHLFPVAEEIGEWLKANGCAGANITVVRNGANIDLFRPLPADKEQAPFVVFFGGLTAWHGVDVMMEAVTHPDWPKGVRLRIIGDGAGRHLVEQASSRGASVDWLGARSYETVPSLIAGAIAGLVPITDPGGRSSEGIGLHPLKLYETLACGIPAIVSDLPGQADVVRQQECGLVFPVGDAAQLARAVSHLSRHPQIAGEMGQRGEQFVRRGESWRARASDIDRVLSDCLAR